MPVYELELMQCKFCPGALKPDVSRKQKAPGFCFYRCEVCGQPNIFAENNAPRTPACLTVD